MRTPAQIQARIQDLYAELAEVRFQQSRIKVGNCIVTELHYWANIRRLHRGIAQLKWALEETIPEPPPAKDTIRTEVQ